MLPTVVNNVMEYRRAPLNVHLGPMEPPLISLRPDSVTALSNRFNCSVTKRVQFFSYNTFKRSANTEKIPVNN